jgi:hypothetical protein
MPAPDRIPGTLQENLLTLLVHSDEHGKIVANLVDPALFEGDYRVVAERAVDYWARYAKAPQAHMADLLSDILDARGDRRAPTFRSIILDMLRLSEEINPKYAIDSLRSFVRMQRFQSAVLETARKLQSMRELALPEVEEMWSELLRARDATLDRGVTLNDTVALIDFLRNTATEFSLGIAELDARGIAPMRGAAVLFIAATGIGKSWALVHAAKRALMERKKVFYASLEMSEGEVLMRLYQAFFSVPDRTLKEPLFVSVLEKDSYGRLAEISREEVVPEFALDGPNLEDELEVRRRLMQGRFKNMEIKRFPTRGLTIGGLRGYLDSLEAAGFIPDVLILDYIGIMRTDVKEHRISLGRNFEDFRGLCVERNIAGITAQQLGREAGRTARGGQTNVAEDWSLIGTADVCISINATSAEKRYGFARLVVEKARRARDRFGVLITQNYDLGQFVLESAPLDEARYEGLFDAYAGGADDQESGGAGDDGD